MSAPGCPTNPPAADAAAPELEATSRSGRPAHAQHLGTSLALLGVMLIFVASMLGAELRELHAWRTRTLREATTLTASRPAAAADATDDDGAYAAVDLSLEALDVQRTATHAFGRALGVAGIGAALAALTVVLRRGRWWVTATALALACLVASTHLFTVARAQLTPSGAEAPPRAWTGG